MATNIGIKGWMSEICIGELKISHGSDFFFLKEWPNEKCYAIK